MSPQSPGSSGSVGTFTNVTHSLTPISTAIPLQSALLIALSQLLPTHTLTLFRLPLALRIPQLPLLHTAILAILSPTPLLPPSTLPLSVLSSAVAYTYLRFYRATIPDLSSSTGVNARLRGDLSDSFAVAEFFPSPLRPAITNLSTHIFNALVAVKLCTPWSDEEMSSRRGAEGTFGRSGRGAGGARAEAERRRAIALRALDQRLAAAGGPAKGAAAPPPPGMAGGKGEVQSQPVGGPQMAVVGLNASGEMLGEMGYVPDGHDERHTGE